jgi:GT2 family glycosyltransferase
MTDVDVIILDIDGGAMLTHCLASLAAQSIAPRKVIVVDNGSNMPVAERVGSEIEILRHEKNVGFAAGVNSAFARVEAPFVALINNDVVLDPDWLAYVRQAMDRDNQLAAVQTIIRRPDGLIDGAGIDISDGTFRQIGHGQPIGSRLAVAWGISGTAALYRTKALGTTIFDERFFAYYEDVELCARLRRDGWRVAVLPVVKATHHGSRTAGVLADALRLRTRNRYLVARMHRRVGSLRALLWEDAKLLLRGRGSWRGVWEGLTAVRVRLP